MSPNMVGALIGFVLGFAGFIVLRLVAARIESREDVPNAGQAASVLRYAALADWLLMIVLGFFVGPLMVSAPN